MNDLRTLIQEGEGYLVEFKESPSHHLERDICAFAKLTREEILSFAIKENRIPFDSQLYVDKTARECLCKGRKRLSFPSRS